MPLQKTHSLEGQYILLGAKAIARATGFSVRTIYRWHRKLNFPTCKMPNGQLGTTHTLIDQWLLARRLAQRNGGQHRP
mgnify:CR=1 FL=1